MGTTWITLQTYWASPIRHVIYLSLVHHRIAVAIALHALF
jgi:hypothetical protein